MIRFQCIGMAAAASAFAALLAMAGCAAEPEMTMTGRYYPVRDSHLILTESGEAIVMGSEDKTVFDSLTIGDEIEVGCDIILTTFPASTEISSLKLLEDGDADDLPEETLSSLLDMGWVSEDLSLK